MDDDNLEDLRHLYFEEIEGERDIKEEPTIEGIHLLPLKTKKVNIGIEDKPNLATIGDYWDEQQLRKYSVYLRNMRTCFLHQ